MLLLSNYEKEGARLSVEMATPGDKYVEQGPLIRSEELTYEPTTCPQSGTDGCLVTPWETHTIHVPQLGDAPEIGLSLCSTIQDKAHLGSTIPASAVFIIDKIWVEP